MVYEVKGNLLESECQYICHQVNCQAKMNSGVAKAIREKWPIVYDKYVTKYDNTKYDILCRYGNFEIMPEVSEVLLGDIQCVYINSSKIIINMFAQQYYGYDGRRYTSYDAFWSCLGKIREEVPEGSLIAFPDHIGSCRGGANWNVIRTMIAEALGNEYEVYIYKLEE
jgi:O-acetyl-ADP-ribose deacetylase (regulator of RNase III)